ncbi:MAG TPA: hypothetical protein VHE14_04530 [Solirubrobacteraceae bacterium]|nr:hypothetical protein [Solirubrobacteraceae bacterium]
MLERRLHVCWAVAAFVAVSALSLGACGGSGKKHKNVGAKNANASALSLSIGESGKAARFTAPASAVGGLVELRLTNTGKAPHAAQLVLIRGNHTAQDALKQLGSHSNKTPAWLRAEGGLVGVPSGQRAATTLNLPAGKYVVVDVGGGPGGPGPPAFAQFTLTPGKAGSLPSTPTTVTAANPSKDRYKWQISGPLNAGANRITFVSKGKSALHVLVAARVTGNPSKATILTALKKSKGRLPAFVDKTSLSSTAVIDGNRSQVTALQLRRPGQYALFCPLNDRDGGKPHIAEGMLTTIIVK